MKVLLVHNSYQQPGGEDVVYQRERDLLKAAGHEVLEYQRSNSEIEDYSVVRRVTLFGRTVWAPDSFQDFSKLLREEPEIVHVHNSFPLISPSIYWACRNARVPVVQTVHNYRLLCAESNFFRDGKPCEDCLHGGHWQGVIHGCYRNSRLQTAAVALMLTVHHARKTWTEMVDCYITLTAFSRSRYLEAGFPADLMKVKPNFVDPDPGKRPDDGSYALFVGRLDEQKGVRTLLKAWAQMPPSAILRIAGDGPSRPQLEAMARDYPNVEFMGWLPHERVFEAMKGARFLVFPSEWYENLPLAIIEAFACGVPVLASGLGAMQELVEHGRTGLLFRPSDPEDLARTMVHAWNQREYMARLGHQARREYETKYTAAANYRQLLDIYTQVLAKRALAAEPHPVATPISAGTHG
jgi:glycosyltransferase involved in cell wall biosynthesis